MTGRRGGASGPRRLDPHDFVPADLFDHLHESDAMDLTHTPGHGWTLTTDAELTDAEALALSFRATPAQVTLGEFVEVVDAGGTRIGHVSTAVYRERHDGPAYVVCTVALR